MTTRWRERAMVAQLMGYRLESSMVWKLDRVAQVEISSKLYCIPVSHVMTMSV